MGAPEELKRYLGKMHLDDLRGRYAGFSPVAQRLIDVSCDGLGADAAEEEIAIVRETLHNGYGYGKSNKRKP